MGITIWEHFHTPLARPKAEELVGDLRDVIESPDETDDGELDDVAVTLEKDAPPSAEEAHARAVATGYTPSSFSLDPAALARLRTCRTTITLQYEGRDHEHPTLNALRKMLLDAIGSAVVASAEDTVVETSETFKQKVIRNYGDLWAVEPEEELDEPDDERDGDGTLEARAVERRLRRALADPFAKKRLAASMRAASPTVQQYAALLLEEEAQSDAAAAATLKCSVSAVASARAALAIMVEAD